MDERERLAPRNLVFVCDGTLSSMAAGAETNAGLLYRLLEEMGVRSDQFIRYDPGVQGRGWRRWLNAASGIGLNRSICRGYAFLSEYYRPGDRIYLFGYSRGAYAVRSLAGMIGQVGLLRRGYSDKRYVDLAFRFYQADSNSPARQAFTRYRCHSGIQIEMLGVWDTVKSLGLPYPILSRLAPMATEFHDDRLGPHIRHGFHALAIDENRTAFRPILWNRSEEWLGRLEQTWFPGAHGDVGGEVRTYPVARPLANIALNWMLRRAARCALHLPDDWESRFPEDPAAPMFGSRRGIGMFFLLRAERRVGRADGETIHLSIRERMAELPDYRPAGRLDAPEGEDERSAG